MAAARCRGCSVILLSARRVWCSDRCRMAAGRRSPAGDPTLADAVRAEVDPESSLGCQALLLAARLGQPVSVSEAGQLHRELREVLLAVQRQAGPVGVPPWGA